RELRYDDTYTTNGSNPVVDNRGFADVMTYLFPDLDDGTGRMLKWRCQEYPDRARTLWFQATSRPDSQARPTKAEVWEPTIRHFARALTALEMTSNAESEAYVHLRVVGEVQTAWLQALGMIIGEASVARHGHLPPRPLP